MYFQKIKQNVVIIIPKILLIIPIMLSACVTVQHKLPQIPSEPVYSTSISIPTETSTIEFVSTITSDLLLTQNTLTKTKIFTFTHTPPPIKREKYDNVSGTYQLRQNDGSGGNLWVIMESLNGSQYVWINVELYYSRGSPSYNQGYFMEKLIYAWNMAVYHRYDICNIVLEGNHPQK